LDEAKSSEEMCCKAIEKCYVAALNSCSYYWNSPRSSTIQHITLNMYYLNTTKAVYSAAVSPVTKWQ